MDSLKPNLSDQEFFNLYVKDKDWYPLQNHGLVDKDIKLQNDDNDFPNQITSYLNLLKNINIDTQSILDIGCGWGRGTNTIKKYNKQCNVLGVDIDSCFINYAKSNFKECNYIQDNLFQSKLKDLSFDIIILNCSMHFFYNRDNALQNIRKKLKNKGKIIVTDLWTKEAFVVFLKKCETNNLKILSIEDQTEDTIKSMEQDISKTYIKFKDKIDYYSIVAFTEIQEERLKLFKQNENRHYKFIIEKL